MDNIKKKRCCHEVEDRTTKRKRVCKRKTYDIYCTQHHELMNNLEEDSSYETIFEDEGKCCFCQEECNPCSQACGRCARTLSWYGPRYLEMVLARLGIGIAA